MTPREIQQLYTESGGHCDFCVHRDRRVAVGDGEAVSPPAGSAWRARGPP